MTAISCFMHALDDTDRRLLRQLQDSPDLPMADLGRRAGISPAVAARRIDRLTEAGAIRGFGIEIDQAYLGRTVSVSLRITLDKTSARAFDEFLAAARKLRQVSEVQTLLGRVDVRLVVEAADLEEYQRIYREDILRLPHMLDIEALMSVADVKRGGALPL